MRKTTAGTRARGRKHTYFRVMKSRDRVVEMDQELEIGSELPREIQHSACTQAGKQGNTALYNRQRIVAATLRLKQPSHTSVHTQGRPKEAYGDSNKSG